MMDLTLLLPELCLLGLAIIMMAADWFVPKGKKHRLGYLGLVGLGCSLWALIFGLRLHVLPDAANLFLTPPHGEMLFQGFVFDSFAFFFKVLFFIIAAVVFIFSIFFFRSQPSVTEHQGEYYALLLFVAMGASLLVSTQDLLVLFVSYELMSIPLYLLCGYLKQDSRSGESGLKYFLVGAVTSALLLYGISFVYGVTGSTDLRAFNFGLFQNPVFLMGVIFILVAFFFKIAVVPFHMWAPDVYEGAPAPVVAFLAVVPKLAIVGLFIRLFLLNIPGTETFLTWALGILAALSMTVGNVMALQQQNLKRLLAYSGIAQIGYVLVGLCSVQAVSSGLPAQQLGYQAVLFYLVVYVFSELAAFGIVTVLAADKSDYVASCRGLSARAPGLSFIFLLGLLSLAGIPPLAGFIGKLYLFIAAFNRQLYWLVALAVGNSVISIFYYLRIAKAMYMEEGPSVKEFPRAAFSMNTALWLLSFAVLMLGVFPKPALGFVQNALAKFLVGF